MKSPSSVEFVRSMTRWDELLVAFCILKVSKEQLVNELICNSNNVSRVFAKWMYVWRLVSKVTWGQVSPAPLWTQPSMCASPPKAGSGFKSYIWASEGAEPQSVMFSILSMWKRQTTSTWLWHYLLSRAISETQTRPHTCCHVFHWVTFMKIKSAR